MAFPLLFWSWSWFTTGFGRTGEKVADRGGGIRFESLSFKSSSRVIKPSELVDDAAAPAIENGRGGETMATFLMGNTRLERKPVATGAEVVAETETEEVATG